MTNLHSPELAAAKATESLAFADFIWLTRNSRTKDSPLDTPVFTGEFRGDANHTNDFNSPNDHTTLKTPKPKRIHTEPPPSPALPTSPPTPAILTRPETHPQLSTTC